MLTSKANRISITLSALLWSANTSAQEDLIDLTLEQLLDVEVVSALRYPVPLVEIPSTVYTITEQQIKRYGFRDLKDILKFIPGVEYSYPHSWLQGGQRGFSDNWSKTKLMIDGVEVNLLFSGEAFIGHQYMADNIRRVEVIHGPGSSLYGADAYAGIINIVTKNPQVIEQHRVSYRRDQGNKDFAGNHLSFYSQNQFDDWRYQIFIGKLDLQDADFTGFVQSTDFSVRQPNRDVRINLINQGDNPYVDDNEALQVNANVRYKLNAQSQIDGHFIYLSDRDGGGLESPEISFRNFMTDRDQKLVSLKYNYKSKDGSWLAKAKVEHHNADELNDLNFRSVINGGLSDLYVFNIPDATEDLFEVQFDFSSDDKLIYNIVGAGYRDKHLPLPEFRLKNPPFTSANSFDDLIPFQNQDIKYLFAQTQIKSSDKTWSTVLGIRHDEHNIYDAPVTKRVGISYRVSNELVASFNYGEAFRAPTMFELESNSALDPAKLDTYELVLKQQHGNQLFQASYYQTDASDLIVQRFDANQIENFITVNEGQVDIEGLELYFTKQTEAGSVSAWLEWTETSEDIDIAEWQAALMYSKDLTDRHTLSVAWRYFGDIDTSYLDENTNTSFMKLDDFYTFDINYLIQQPFDIQGTRVNLSVRNLLDDDSRYTNVRGNDPIGFMLQGVNLSLGVELDF